MRQNTTFDIRKYIGRKLQRIVFIETDEDFYITPPLTINFLNRRLPANSTAPNLSHSCFFFANKKWVYILSV
tara:strand:- start:10471 stop:10686 length:216 start_codon:yes stop_codon:yes gene_type:complete